MKLRFVVGRAKGSEKAVLPTIVYCNILDEGIRCVFIGLGWWDWSVGILTIYRAGAYEYPDW